MLAWFALAALCTAAPHDFVHEEDVRDGEAEDAPAPPMRIRGTLGAQWLWAAGKAMPGIVLRGGERWLWVDLEASLIALTEASPVFDSRLLGSQLGFYAMFQPFYTERWELAAGLGADVYPLWNLHGDEWQAALSARLAGRFWFVERGGVFVTARAYPIATSGLELGVTRERTRGLPVLFGTGVEWRFQ